MAVWITPYRKTVLVSVTTVSERRSEGRQTTWDPEKPMTRTEWFYPSLEG